MQHDLSENNQYSYYININMRIQSGLGETRGAERGEKLEGEREGRRGGQRGGEEGDREGERREGERGREEKVGGGRYDSLWKRT